MRKRKWSIIILSIPVIFGVVAWSPGVLEDLVIGSSNANLTSPGNPVLGVIGNANEGMAKSTLVVGENNDVSLAANTLTSYSVVAGLGNVLEKDNSRNLVSGETNTVQASTSFVAGHTNSVKGPTLGTAASYSAAIGAGNNVLAQSGWTMGQYNTVTGDKSTAIGFGLNVSQAYSVAVGAYNASTSTSDVFVVGNGISTTRSTAFRVTYSGDVILGKAQGDISMGDYE